MNQADETEYPQASIDLSFFAPHERRELSHALARAQVHAAVDFHAFPPGTGHGDTVFNDLGVLIAALDTDLESCRLGGWTEARAFRARELTNLIERLTFQGKNEPEDTALLISRLLAEVTARTGYVPPTPPAQRVIPGRVTAAA